MSILVWYSLSDQPCAGSISPSRPALAFNQALGIADVGPDQGEECPLQLPNQDFIELMLRMVPDPSTILSALAASKALRQAAVQLVDCIHAKELPPARIWNRFPRAKRVVMMSSAALRVRLEAYERLVGSLPVCVSSIGERPASGEMPQAEQPSPARSLSFARALLASACASSLLSLQISSVSFTPAAADTMLQGLPQLQEARLVVHREAASQPGAQQHVWRPQVSGCPELLTLEVSSAPNASSRVTLDLAALTSATKLQRLAAEVVTNITALAALTSLQSLDLAGAECSAATWAVLAKLPKLGTLSVRTLEISADAAVAAAAVTCLHVQQALQLLHDEEQLPGCLARQLPQLRHAQLGPLTPSAPVALGMQGHQQLRELVMSGAVFNAQAWAVLAALPSLETLRAVDVAVDAAAPVAAALHTLDLDAKLILQHTVQQLPGWLTQQLPQLQQLTARADLKALSAALQGHQQLQQLTAYHETNDPGAAADLHSDVLADLATCSRLAVVKVQGQRGLITAAVCAALAAGACRDSLRVVKLRPTEKLLGSWLEACMLLILNRRPQPPPPPMMELGPADLTLACVGPLLHMPALEKVALQLYVDEQIDKAGVQQQAEQVLYAAGLPDWEVVGVQEPVSCERYSNVRKWECKFACQLASNG